MSIGPRQSRGGNRAGSGRPDGGDLASVDDAEGHAGFGVNRTTRPWWNCLPSAEFSGRPRQVSRRMAHVRPVRPASLRTNVVRIAAELTAEAAWFAPARTRSSHRARWYAQVVSQAAGDFVAVDESDRHLFRSGRALTLLVLTAADTRPRRNGPARRQSGRRAPFAISHIR